MHTTLQTTYQKQATGSVAPHSLWSVFINWCTRQEKNRFLWLAVGLTGHGCFLTPVTLMAVMLTGNSMILWGFAIAAMTMTVVTNLAALPTKITLPVFFLSLLIDAAVIVGGIASLYTLPG